MSLSLIVAATKERAIGVAGVLPWKRLAADMRRFKELTTGHPVIMGRKTFESIPPKFRPLPGRANIVVTRKEGYQAEGVLIAHGLAEAVRLAEGQPGSEEVFVIGGGELYAAAMPLAATVYYTKVESDGLPADAYFPALDDSEWEGQEVGSFEPSEGENDYGGTFYVYRRTGRYPIVQPLNGRTSAYKEDLAKILRSGTCPFCPDGKTLKEQEIIHWTDSWWVSKNAYPMPQALGHFIIVPVRHRERFEQLEPSELTGLQEAMTWLEKEYSFPGMVYFWRQGNPLVTGATVSHIHLQAFVPAESQAVYFGKFKEGA